MEALRSRPRVVMAVLVGVLLLVVFLLSRDKPAYESAAANYVSYVDDQNYTQAYGLLCDKQKKLITDTKQLETEQGAAWKTLTGGKEADVSVTGSKKQGKHATVEVQVTAGESKKYIQVSMQYEQGKWHYCGGQVVAKSGVKS